MNMGKVYLVGAGPGHPGLITVRGWQVLQQADAVLHDALVNPALLAAVRNDAQVINVGKRGLRSEALSREASPSAQPPMTSEPCSDESNSACQVEPGSNRLGKCNRQERCEQEQINRQMIELAQAGQTVCRLKGGDPFVFGRGGEEADTLLAAGIPFEVVPGVTSGIGGLAYAGMPLTFRDVNRAACLVTGHDDPDDAAHPLDWSALARIGNLIFYMGLRHVDKIARKLQAAGLPQDTPAAIVERASWPSQRVLVGTVETISALAKREDADAPALLVFGGMVQHRERLNWFERLPLFGKRVLVTRAATQAEELSTRLAELGADVLEAPMIQIVPPSDWGPVDRALQNLAHFDWMVWTSANGVQATVQRMRSLGLDGRALAGRRLAGVGSATVAELEKYFLRADLWPEEFSGEKLAQMLMAPGVKEKSPPAPAWPEGEGSSFLLLRSNIARPELPSVLRSLGAKRVEDVPVYLTQPTDGLPEPVLAALQKGEVDWVTFTSPGTVRNFVRLLSLPTSPDGKGGGIAPAMACRAASPGGPWDRLRAGPTLLPCSRAGLVKPSFQVASIGPTTSAALRECGLTVDAEAEPHTIAGLVEALVRHTQKAIPTNS